MNPFENYENHIVGFHAQHHPPKASTPSSLAQEAIQIIQQHPERRAELLVTFQNQVDHLREFVRHDRLNLEAALAKGDHVLYGCIGDDYDNMLHQVALDEAALSTV